MPAQTRQQTADAAAKRAKLDRQAKRALALRKLVNALVPDTVFVTSELNDGAYVVRLNSSGNPEPFYSPGYKQRNVEKGVTTEPLTKEQKRHDSRESGMVQVEGFLAVVAWINDNNDDKQPLRLEVIPLSGLQKNAVFTNGVSTNLSHTIKVYQQDNHYFPQGKSPEDVTTAKNSCAFGSLIVWLEDNDQEDRLQPLIDQGITAGVDADCLAILQNYVDGVDSVSSSDEESSCDGTEVASPADDSYVALFSRIAASFVHAENKMAVEAYAVTVTECMRAVEGSTSAAPLESRERMSLFIQEQERLVKHFEKLKESRSRSGSDASDGNQSGTDLSVLD